MSIVERHKTQTVQVGGVAIGGDQPVRVQSMTDTNTADAEATVAQVIALADAGSELVRLTVNTPEAAAQVPVISEALLSRGYDVPLIGDFHYNGHRLLNDYPDCAKALAKYRINPGNVGFGDKRDKQFAQMIEAALHYDKPVRIGVNWGSLDQALLAEMMDVNAKSAQPKGSQIVLREAIIASALNSAAAAQQLGMAKNKMILSCKVSEVPDLIAIYEALASRCDYALHLGLTEAGMGSKAITATAAAFGVLLQQGIGDTIRASLTPPPGGARTEEVRVCQEILQGLQLRVFNPQVTSCPGCGRTSSDFFRRLAAKIQTYIADNMPSWRVQYPGIADLKIAVMGCVVNGPGESKQADIGISLPGSGEDPSAPVFIDGKKAATLRGSDGDIAEQFQQMLMDYIGKRFNEK